MKKILLNISNHQLKDWDKKQREGWDEIINIPFPNVNPRFSEKETDELEDKIIEKIREAINGRKEKFYCMLQGEFSVCYGIFWKLKRYYKKYRIFSYNEHFIEGKEPMEFPINFVIPTTERIVEEKDGVKKSIFKFVSWREI